ncbi:multisubunit Na+/H+ antiporter MnhE subunit [Oxalobacteraceae bacterium GrIS 1.18]
MSIRPNLKEFIKRFFANPFAVWVLGTFLGVVGGILALENGTYSLNRISVGGIFGFAVGAAYVVEVKCKVPILISRLICSLIGLAAGFAICLILSFSMTGILIGAIVGFILGAISREWIDQINFP